MKYWVYISFYLFQFFFCSENANQYSWSNQKIQCQGFSHKHHRTIMKTILTFDFSFVLSNFLLIIAWFFFCCNHGFFTLIDGLRLVYYYNSFFFHGDWLGSWKWMKNSLPVFLLFCNFQFQLYESESEDSFTFCCGYFWLREFLHIDVWQSAFVKGNFAFVLM